MAELVKECYANALFDACVEDDCYAQVCEELSAYDEVFEQSVDYKKILSAPVISIQKKHELITSITTLKSGCAHIFVKNLMFLLCDNGRFKEFHGICEAFSHLCDEKENRLRVKAITAFPLSEELQKKLSLKLENLLKKQIFIKNIVNKALLGGIKLQYNNTEVDASVLAGLTTLRAQIKEERKI